MNVISTRFYKFLIIAGVLLNATALFSDILEPDGALYAAIAKHIALTNDWVNLFGDGHDWLDKPHLPFWLAAISFKCLGVSAFAYKLPAFLCWLIGLHYTYRLASLLYNQATALVSVLIYSTALHAVLANFDVRAEAYLTAFVIAAIYHLYRASQEKRWIGQLVAGSLFCALAVMTKGIFVLVTIGGGLVMHQLITQQWRWLLLSWWLVALLTGIFILPELYSLYMQFDSHPEKVVFGQTHVSGLRFFFWDSQFGRFFNSGPIRGHGDVFFFLHTVLWAFLPWSVLLYVAVVQHIRQSARYMHPQHWVGAGSALVSFLLFSFSKFQLPHYIVIVFPQLAMLTAQYLVQVSEEKAVRRITLIQTILLCLGAVLLLALTWCSGIGNTIVQTVWIGIAFLAGMYLFRKATVVAALAKSVAFAVMLFVFLNLLFYPHLLQYQAGMRAGKYIQQQDKAGSSAVMYRCNVYSFEFYAPSLVLRADSIAALRHICSGRQPALVFLPETVLPDLQNHSLHIQVRQRFANFHISQLTPAFLNPSQRAGQLESYLLAEVSWKE